MSALILLAVTIAGAGNAFGLVVRLREGAAVSYQPVPGPQTVTKMVAAGGPPLEYHGGAVVASNTNYLIFWKGAKAKFASGYVAGVTAYMKGIAHEKR